MEDQCSFKELATGALLVEYLQKYYMQMEDIKKIS